jgi:hypothetical protein
LIRGVLPAVEGRKFSRIDGWYWIILARNMLSADMGAIQGECLTPSPALKQAS